MSSDEEMRDEAAKKEDESSDDSDSDDSGADEVGDATLRALSARVEENPYIYDAHTELIQALRQNAELTKLREARNEMNKIFPLTEKLWLEWVEDEVKIGEDDRETITQLFDRAVQDYMCVGVWLEYVQYAIGGMGQPGGLDKIRAVFERAITAVGLHVARGAMIWDAYREFENAILMGLQPGPGAVSTTEQQENINAQMKRIESLFRRQLAVPLQGMESTYAEYREWCSEQPETHIEYSYKKASKKLEELVIFEDNLTESEAPHLEAYQAYIQHELGDGQPARIQCVYERAIEENCLLPTLWVEYCKYVDRKLRVGSVSVALHERSVKNCPWSSQLWVSYVTAMERYNKEHSEISEVFSQALKSGFGSGADFLNVWTAQCDYLRRRINWSGDHTDDLEKLRETITEAISHLETNFPEDGDPNQSLRQYQARMEAKFAKNMPKARELWQEIIQQGFGNQAASWLEYYNLERAYGDRKHCRKLLQRAVNSVNDYPESVCEAYMNFEREEGSLDDYDQAVERCDSQLKRVEERRQNAAEKEQHSGYQHRDQQKGNKKFPSKNQAKSKTFEQKPKGKNDAQSHVTYKRKHLDEPQSSETKKPKVQKSATEESREAMPPPGFKGKKKADSEIMPPPGFRGKGNDNAPPGYKGKKGEDSKSAPPPGFRGDSKPGGSTEPMETEHSHPKTSTVFISNLDYKTKAHQLHEIFSKLGEVKMVDVVKGPQGKSKGYAYIEFADELLAQKALAYDHQPIEGRPMFVSAYTDKETRTKVFKYSTAMETNKLFIKGLPYKSSQEDIEALFSKHGPLKSVRLVTYRNGFSKGLAYVEYEKESDAAQAVMKTDQLQVGEQTISVSISNPPQRKQPVDQRHVASLGSGKRETEQRGKARTQLSLVPRAVRKPTGGDKPTTTPRQPDTTSTAQSQPQEGKKSNDDFRNMFLKKS